MDFGCDELGDSGPKKPGRKLFSEECKAVLGRLIVGGRSPEIMDHIQNCGPCFMVVFGDDDIMPTSIFDDIACKHLVDEVKAKSDGRVPPSKDVVEHSIGVTLHEFHALMNTSTVPGDPAERPVGFESKRPTTTNVDRGAAVAEPLVVNAQSPTNAATAITATSSPQRTLGMSRRRMIGWIAAAAVAVVAGTLPMIMRNSEAQRSPASANTGIPMAPGRMAFLAKWDAAYQGSNTAAVRALMARSTTKELRSAMEWIAERRITPLYGDLVGYLFDPNIAIRRGAIMNLILIPPLDLKPLLATIQSARSLETDVPNQATLDELVVAVMKA